MCQCDLLQLMMKLYLSKLLYTPLELHIRASLAVNAVQYSHVKKTGVLVVVLLTCGTACMTT